MNGHASALPAGTPAPDFDLQSTPDQRVYLHEFRGQPVILAFYPADWSPVCGDQMALYNEVLPEFQRLGAELIGISVDGVWCHLAFAKDRALRFPLLADFEPKGAVAADNPAFDMAPPAYEGAISMHGALIGLLGIAIGEMWYLEDLAADCAGDGVYEFFLTSAPLNMPGGSGSPPNALAIK